jgi:hypothetical protein
VSWLSLLMALREHEQALPECEILLSRSWPA